VQNYVLFYSKRFFNILLSIKNASLLLGCKLLDHPVHLNFLADHTVMIPSSVCMSVGDVY